MDYSYLDRAVLECERAIETKSNAPQGWQAAFTNLGNILQSLGKFDGAIFWHSLASEASFDLAEAYCELGELYLSTNNFAAALKAWQNALQCQPNSVKILVNLARLQARLGHKEAEILTWYRLSELKPDFINPSGYYKLGRALQQRGVLDKAVNCYRRALADNQLFIAANYELGLIYIRQKKLELAKKSYLEILARDAAQAEALHQLGTIYLQQQSFAEAIDCFQKTIEYAPDFPGAHYDLVKTYLRLQRWSEAIATCHFIINLIEPYPWAYSFLGHALRAKGQYAEAAANFQKACQGRGWHECATNDYLFTVDRFSEKIPVLTIQLQSLLTGNDHLNFLEIGSDRGMSACWLLDKILVNPADRLTCVEEQCDALFRDNLAKTGSEERVNILEGDVPTHIASLPPEHFDLINLYDRSKLAASIERRAILAWKTLKSGGLLIFNDYGVSFRDRPEFNPTEGIERFLVATKGHWKWIHHSPANFLSIVRKL